MRRPSISASAGSRPSQTLLARKPRAEDAGEDNERYGRSHTDHGPQLDQDEELQERDDREEQKEAEEHRESIAEELGIRN